MFQVNTLYQRFPALRSGMLVPILLMALAGVLMCSGFGMFARPPRSPPMRVLAVVLLDQLRRRRVDA